MPVGFPTKTTYANGDVFSADDINSTNGTINLLGSSVAYAAGKNRIINGDLRFNQRNFTSAGVGYNFDRFYAEASGGTLAITPQTFTSGTAPVSGYEATNFMRSTVSGQSAAGDYVAIGQKMEDVRTFAGQTITVSFWAKASTGTPKVSVEMQQVFGSGGSGAVLTSAAAASTLSTSWARYTTTINVPSISGKTIGTSSSFNLFIWISAGTSFNSRANSIGIQNATLDFWGFQVEQGSTATAFQTATGTIQGELAACQRYFQQINPNSEIYGYCYATNSYVLGFTMPVTPRVIPTGITVVNIATTLVYNQLNAGFLPSAITINSAATSLNSVSILATATGTAGNVGRLGLGGTTIQITGCEL